MSTAASQPATSLSDRFAWAVGLLCRAVAGSGPKHGSAAPLAVLAWVRLQRLLARFVTLVASVQAGRFPVPRHRATQAASPPRPSAGLARRLPGGFGWLLRLAPALDMRIGRSQIETLLGDPELAALLTAAPRAGRILRPLCHMLKIELPPALRLERRPPQPRRKPPSEAARGGGTPAASGASCSPPWRQGRDEGAETGPFVLSVRQAELLELLCPSSRKRPARD